MRAPDLNRRGSERITCTLRLGNCSLGLVQSLALLTRQDAVGAVSCCQSAAQLLDFTTLQARAARDATLVMQQTWCRRAGSYWLLLAVQRE
jgi:hypothetical protein